MGELGTRLIRAREARGLTLEDAERDTRISRRYLDALESERFELIPAPVYARGFLRSYSQYLGMDPQEMLALFPRDGEAPPRQPARASNQNPVSATSQSRPAWSPPRRPTPGRDRPRPEQDEQRPAQPAARRESPPQQPPPRPTPAPEPTIGVDIGVPAPNRRINPGGSGQARSMLVLAVAAGAVLLVIILAFVISSLGGDDDGTPDGTVTGTSTTEGTTTTTETATSTTTVLAGTSGVVPDLFGMNVDDAIDELEALGYVPREIRETSTSPAGTVTDQAPAPNVPLAAGSEVTLVVSSGP